MSTRQMIPVDDIAIDTTQARRGIWEKEMDEFWDKHKDEILENSRKYTQTRQEKEK
jgi:hypothetical protein